MTFTPNVLSRIDTNNTFGGTGYTGFTPTTYTPTTGYNTINLGINSTNAIDINVEFSNIGPTGPTDSNLTYKDSVFANTQYNEQFQIQGGYYRLNISSTSGSTGTWDVVSVLSTDNNSNSKKNINYGQNMSNNFELDAFGKLRVSNPFTLIDINYPAPNNNSELITTGITGATAGATGNFGYTGAYCNLYATGQAQLTSQSRRYCNYQPGKSLLFLGSGVINAGYSGHTGNDNGYYTRIGYFDNNNGVYFEYNSTTSAISVNIKNNGSVSSVSQNDWNVDRMKGFGTSGLNLTWTNTQLFVIDMEWLGVGRVRFGFYGNGKINYCHQFLNLNSLTTPYMETASLPIRYQIDGLTGGTGQASLTQICSTVISEGGYNPLGRPFSISGSFAVNAGTTYPILAIQANTLSTNYRHQNIIPSDIQIASTGANDLNTYNIYYFPAPAAPVISYTQTTNQVDSTYSISNYTTYSGTGTIGLTGGILISKGYSAGRGTTNLRGLNDTFGIIDLTSNLTNTSDILLITVSSTANTTINCALSFFET